MKILFVTNSLGIAGAERQISIVANAVNTRTDHKIDVVYYKKMTEEFNIDGCDIYLIDKDKLGKIKTEIELIKLIRRNKYDVVHAMGGGTANIYGRLAAIFAKVPVVIGAMLGQKHFASKSMRLFNKLINRVSDYWTINNEALRPILLDSFPNVPSEHVFYVHNGYYGQDSIDYKEDVVTEYDKDKNNNFTFGCVGRLTKVKNYPMFVDAASIVIKKNTNVRFWIFGDGELSAGLEQSIKEKHLEDYFRLWGVKRDIDAALNRMDVYVLTSNTEGTPNALIEALRAGKPIISTNCTNLSEMIDEGNNGYIIPVGDAEALAEKMLDMIREYSENKESYEKRSNELFKQTYSVNRACDELIHVYQTVMKEVVK